MKIHNITHNTVCLVCKSPISYIGKLDTEYNVDDFNRVVADSVTAIEGKDSHGIDGHGKKQRLINAEIVVTCPNCSIKNKFFNNITVEQL